MTTSILWAILSIIILAFVQNTSFSLVSRSRNRDNMRYHIIASLLSNTLWFMTFKQLILTDMAWYMLPGYALGTISGSVFGVKISMRIERWLGAASDSHLKVKPTVPAMKLCSRYIDDVKEGFKNTTVRHGDRDVKLGAMVFTETENPDNLCPVIVERVDKLKFKTINHHLALKLGYNSTIQLYEQMKEFYPDCTTEDIFTIITFRYNG